MKKTTKIGVMTFSPMTLNPGTVLQSWSLCHFLDSLSGIESEVIWYKSNKANSQKKFSLRTSLRTLYIRICQLFHCGFAKKIRKYPTNKPLVRDNVSSINGRYDLILVGSDQVWNPEITGYDNSFFLDFVEGAKKAAYAPSIGKDDWSEELKPVVQDFLKDFEFIGLREKTSIPAVEKLSKKTVHWSIDPTFLINKTEWSSVAVFPKEQKESYIMEYCIKGKSKFPVFAQATKYAANTLGIPSIEIKKWHISADQWIGYLLNAKLVITDSFHGMAFSINNNIPFYVIISSNGNRITSLLNMLGLQDRLITSADDMDLSKEIDWEPVNKKLEEIRTENQTWLKESIYEALKDKL